MKRTTLTIIKLTLGMTFVISVVSGCLPTIVKDPWDSSSRPRYYQLRVITTNPKAAQAFRQGCLAVERQDWAAAIDHFTTALKTDPGFKEAQFELGRAERPMHDYEAAIVNLEQVLKTSPDDISCKNEIDRTRQEGTTYYTEAARAARKAKETDETIENLYRKALFLDSSNREVLLELAQFRREKGNLLMAKHDFQALLDLDPGNRSAAVNLARINLESGDLLQARRILQKAQPPDKNDAEITELLRQIQEKLGENGPPSQLMQIDEKPAITRADLASLIAAIIRPAALSWKSSLKSAEPVIVLDVGEDWAAPSIKEVLHYRIMKPFPNHTFKPEKVISRDELAGVLAFLVTQAETTEPPHESTALRVALTDVSTDHTMFREITSVLRLGLMSTDELGRFFPHSPIAGHHAISILDNVKKILVYP